MKMNEDFLQDGKGIVHLLCIHGDLEGILDELDIKGQRRITVKKAVEVLIGLSLKGYEGRSVGAIYLIGDIDGIRRNTTQMIINPFKGWKDIAISDDSQLPTIEAFTQLDGAVVLDNRGFFHYAGRMVHVKEDECEDRRRTFDNRKGKGSGTRWRAARFITMKTRTIAATLSNSGSITVFKDGKEKGKLERRLCSMRIEDLPIHIYPADHGPS